MLGGLNQCSMVRRFIFCRVLRQFFRCYLSKLYCCLAFLVVVSLIYISICFKELKEKHELSEKLEREKNALLEENQKEIEAIQNKFESKQKSLEKQKKAIVSGTAYFLYLK